MPQPPYALLRASINGGAVQTGGIVVAGSASVQLSADPAGAADVSRYKYEILDFPPSWPVPAGWSTAADGSYFYSSGATPPPFAVGAIASFGTYMLRLTVDNAVSNNPAAVPTSQLIDETTCLEVISNSGIRHIGWHESTQFGGLKWWMYKLSINWRLIDAWMNGGGGGGGGVTAHGALTGLSADDHTQYLRTDGARALTGNQAVGGHKITGLADPTAAQDAATKAYVDSVVPTVTGVIRANGSVAFTAAQPMGGFKLTGLGTPTVSTDAATKGYVDLQIIPAGTNPFTGDQSMGGHKLTNLATPTVSGDAASKAYVDLTILPTGAVAFTANQSMGGHKLTNLATPTVSTDAVTKAYADALVGTAGPAGPTGPAGPAGADAFNAIPAPAALTGGTQTVAPGVTGVRFTLPAASMSANSVLTMVAGTGLRAYDVVFVEVFDVSAFTYTIRNGGANPADMIVKPVSPGTKRIYSFQYDGADFFPCNAVAVV